MYVSAGFLNTKWGVFEKKTLATLAPLTYIDAAHLQEHLDEDARQVAYSAVVSIADAIRGIESRFYSWSTVKLYYSLFYTLRAFLCFDGTALFFSAGKPFRVKALAGAYPQSVNTQSSHKAVMQIFNANYGGSLLLSQTIGLKNPFEWMQHQREIVNYRNAKFVEPHDLSSFKGLIQSKSIRRAISTYVDDQTLSFDEDHAVLAYPILALTELKKLKPDLFSDDDQVQLRSLLSDSQGRIASFDKIIL